MAGRVANKVASQNNMFTVNYVAMVIKVEPLTSAVLSARLAEYSEQVSL